jgi:putative ABC transport system permease protein
MLRNYFLTAIRSLKRNKLHASINIVGLAIGMTCCILIILFIQFELGYDRQNKNASRIYRLGVDLEANDWAISAFPLGSLLKENFPEVEQYTRIKPIETFIQNSTNLVKHKEKVFFADSTVFDVLDIKMLKGNATNALAKINSMVLTPARAKAYFGDEDPIGKTLTRIDSKTEFVITGIFEPLPSNSHVHMDIMVSSENFGMMRANAEGAWNYLTNHYTYLVLPESFDYVKFETTISKFLDKYHELKPEDTPNVLRLQPLTDIHLHSNRGLEVEANGNMNTVYILSAIAFFILVIACINFMNLTTAQSLKRAREVGVRKVVGSKRSHLVFQFLSESVLISLISLSLAAVLLTMVVPKFNELSGKHLVLNPVQNITVVLAFIGIAAVVGFVAGLYPAFFLSKFNPTTVLKGNFATNLRGQNLRKGLVVFQFAIAFIIMVGTYVVHSQLEYMRTKDMGFDREQTLIVKMPNDSIGSEAIKNEMARLSSVGSVTQFIEIPGKMVRTTGIWYEGVKDNAAENLYIFSGDVDLIQTMGMKMKAGRYFERGTKQFGKEFVLNETAVKHFGWKPEEAIGKLIDFGARGENPGKVIGIVEDFHFKDLHETIDPLVMYLEPMYEGCFMAMKLNAGNVVQSVAEVQGVWKQFLPQHEFEYQFLDESFNSLFDQEKRLSTLFTIFSGLAILISCLGLFGLASFTMEQNRKSVAIRKVMGASVSNILYMMSKDFLKLVLVGMVVASPVAYYAMTKWLQGFAYSVGFGWLVFIYAAVVALLVAFITVSYHSFKAATTNPVNSLKDS